MISLLNRSSIQQFQRVWEQYNPWLCQRPQQRPLDVALQLHGARAVQAEDAEAQFPPVYINGQDLKALDMSGLIIFRR